MGRQIGLLPRHAQVVQERQQQFERSGVVDEARLERSHDVDELLDAQRALGALWLERRERALDQLAGETGQRQGAGAR